MDLTIPDGNGPLYARIASGVRRALSEQDIQPGTELMTSEELAKTVNVNVNTALRAYRSLADDQLIELRRGARPKVMATPDDSRLHELAEQLVAQARHLGVSRGELVALVMRHSWNP